MHCFSSDEEYDLVLQDLKGESVHPCRALKQKIARHRSHLGVTSDGAYVTFDGKRMMKEGESHSLISKVHVETGHGCWHKTFVALAKVAYGISEGMVKEQLQGCDGCERMLHKDGRVRESHPIETQGVWEHIQLDLIDLRQYSAENDGFSWILTIVDLFSRYCMVAKLKHKTAVEVGSSLNWVMSTFGAPQILQSDNGKEFRNEIVETLAASEHVKVTHGRPRHPSTQGAVERMNQTIETIYGKLFGGEAGKKWVDKIDRVVWTYNTRPHEVFWDLSPAEVFFGRPLTGHVSGETVEEQQRSLAEQRTVINERALKKVSKHVRRRMNAVERKTKTKMAAFQEGSEVLVAVEGSDTNQGALVRSFGDSRFRQAGTVVSAADGLVRVKDASGEVHRYPQHELRVRKKPRLTQTGVR